MATLQGRTAAKGSTRAAKSTSGTRSAPRGTSAPATAGAAATASGTTESGQERNRKNETTAARPAGGRSAVERAAEAAAPKPNEGGPIVGRDLTASNLAPR